jgi:hypothetical protein
LITDKGMDGLIVVHVPMAVIIFGLVTWLSVAAATSRRAAAPTDPYGSTEASAAVAAASRSR